MSGQVGHGDHGLRVRPGRDGLAASRPTDRSHIRDRRRAAAEGERREIHESVVSLHAFVDLVDRVRVERIRGLGLLVALNVADVVTTAWFLAWGGTEGNPVLAPIVDRWWLVVALKAAILACVAKGVLGAAPRSASVRPLVLAALLFYTAVVAWNIAVIAHLA